MAIDQESFNKRLYDLLKTRGYKPVSKNSNNENIPHPQDADIFEFNFIKEFVLVEIIKIIIANKVE